MEYKNDDAAYSRVGLGSGTLLWRHLFSVQLVLGCNLAPNQNVTFRKLHKKKKNEEDEEEEAEARGPDIIMTSRRSSSSS